MAFFKREEDEWEIVTEDSLDGTPDEPVEPPHSRSDKKKQSSKPKRKKKEIITEDYEFNEEPEIDYLDSELHYEYDPSEHQQHWNWWIILPTVCLLIFFSLLGIGYLNTDFDQKGDAYVVPLEIHYERRYVNTSDDTLLLLDSIANSLYNESEQLKINTIVTTEIMTQQMNDLNSKVNRLSRYIGVPTKMNVYHTQLINFGLKTEQFMQTLIDNITNADYDAFRNKGMEDLLTEYDSILFLREQIDDQIFRNITDDGSNGGILNEKK